MTTDILNHFLQSTAFALVCAAFTLMLRQNRAHVRYALWVAASLKFLIPFAALIALGRAIGHGVLPAAHGPQVAYVINFVTQPIARTVIPAATRAPVLIASAATRASEISTLLIAVWAAGSLPLAARWMMRWSRIAGRLKRDSVAADGREVAILRRLEQTEHVQRPLTVVITDAAYEPGVFGVIKPRLAWPRGISAHLDDSHIETILRHELSHVARRDNLMAALQMLVQAAFWFHPLVWWIGRRLVDERERACDEDVLRQGSEPEVYAESILKTCRFAIESPLMCVAGVTGADLKGRIERIMGERTTLTLGSAKRLVLVAAAAVAIAAPLICGALNAPRVQAQSGGLRIGEVKFEIASVKPNRSGEQAGSLRRLPGGRTTATNMPLRQLITFAFQLSPLTLVGGPTWIDESRFDIVAKLEGDPPPAAIGGGPDPMMLAMRTLLADRFQLGVHAETRELDVYAMAPLRAGRATGPALKPSTQDCSPETLQAMLGRGATPSAAPPSPSATAPPQCGMRMMPGHLAMGGLPLAMLTRPLGGIVGRIILDRTDLPGNWDAELKFAAAVDRLPPDAKPALNVDPDAPSIFTAIQEQWGLKLESTKAPVDVLVIDKIEAPTPD